jgi:hypothetical protein
VFGVRSLWENASKDCNVTAVEGGSIEPVKEEFLEHITGI